MNKKTQAEDRTDEYSSAGGVRIRRTQQGEPYENAMETLVDALDERRGVALASSYEYPGRYTRWDMGFVDPPLALEGRGRAFRVSALNTRGRVLIPAVEAALHDCDAVEGLEAEATFAAGRIRESDEWFPEELRSRQPTVFSVVRALIALFAHPEEPHLGFYGAFGYELAFQFEAIRLEMARGEGERDLVLYLPDDILVVDHQAQRATRFLYDFGFGDAATGDLPRVGTQESYSPAAGAAPRCDHGLGEYEETVRAAIEAFARGDLFEVVPGQNFYQASPAPPSEVFRRLRRRNPAPYGALLNLGEQEYLVAASPEMYVRVDGRRVETCPISGTIARGASPIEDSTQILALLNSKKDESELTMCTDVDRNDKSRVCVPGSVRVIGRRQIEMYSRLIHTVDHVVGELRDDFDALDAFLAHAWAVTVTGAPKQHAIQFIEDHERSPRRWYGGALGFVGFNGNLNTGLTLRTVHIEEGIASVRAGATLLFESDPEAEEAETRLKASALLDAIRRPEEDPLQAGDTHPLPGAGKRIVMVDHEDSFVHTLAGYFRQTGAEVVTFRSGFPCERLREARPDLVLLSPGPGRPEDFALDETIAMALAEGLPIFGVCLGLQGLVVHYGGHLDTLEVPMHGKASEVTVLGGRLLEGLPGSFEAGRYHSLFARTDTLPECFELTARSADGVVMAIEHRELPVAAVQFHPESIMSLAGGAGMRLVHNVVSAFCP